MAITGLPNSGGSGGSGLTESQIKQIILADLQTPGTQLYSECESIANKIDVASYAADAVADTNSTLYQNVVAAARDINVLEIVYQDLQLTNQNPFLFEAISTIASTTSEEVINSALDGHSNGIIHQAIVNTMLAPGGGGVIYNAIENTAESIVNSFADAIGVGNSQYFNVTEAADAVITNQLLLGGTIDVAIKAGGA